MSTDDLAVALERARNDAAVLVADLSAEAATVAECSTEGCLRVVDVDLNAVVHGLRSLDAAALDALAARHATGRLGTSEEVAALTAFLVGDAASFVTGSYHLLDGGYSAH